MAATLASGVLFLSGRGREGPDEQPDISISSRSRSDRRTFDVTPAQWATLAAEPVQRQAFRIEHVTEGRIAVDEDRCTPIFSPYSGRVTKLLARPGDTVTAGQPLFVVEATDMVQAQNDARSAQTALEAARNRLRILGRTDDEIAAFQDKGRSPEIPINAPIGGTIVQRKVGLGQYVSAGAGDPVFVIGDLSTVRLTAYVRETEAARVRVGEEIRFNLMAHPDRLFRAKLDYVATGLDPASRRLMVGATVDNADRQLEPEMYANVIIVTQGETESAAVPREALIHEGNAVRVWVAHDDKTIELRQIKIGLSSGRMIQVLEGLGVGERVITPAVRDGLPKFSPGDKRPTIP